MGRKQGGKEDLRQVIQCGLVHFSMFYSIRLKRAMTFFLSQMSVNKICLSHTFLSITLLCLLN